MDKVIMIRKGLDMKLQGEAERVLTNVRPALYAVKPTDFHGVLPKLLVSPGDRVLAGTPLFFDKYNERIQFTSPVSGVVEEVRRGDRRRLEEIVVRADEDVAYRAFDVPDLPVATAESITEVLLASGLWPLIRQRPYGVIATPGVAPRSVFISAFDTAPLAPDLDFLISRRGHEFQLGIDVLRKLSGAPVQLNVHADKSRAQEYLTAREAELNFFRGPHPAGNVGIQIHHIDPVVKGDVVWVIHPLDIAMIGRFFMNKQYDTTRVVALAGSGVKHPRYFNTRIGATIAPMVEGQLSGDNPRFISGNVLTGMKISQDGFLGFYDHSVTVIPEGNHYEFMGWASPGFRAFSHTRAFLSKLFHRKPFAPHTNLNGGERAFVVTGQYEKVFPMDIFPMQLLKAIMIKDIDLMENLGIYEVVEEDMALCEVMCTSKIEVQSILREGLDLMKKEMS
jgi:Na+-transporting NADH:ubiquinone oxidoreductase subunit A